MLKNYLSIFTSFSSFLIMLICYFSSTVYALDDWEVSLDKAPSGKFDFLVYAVSWDPGFCAIHKNFTENCVNKFKVHGVWPYYKTDGRDNIRNYHPSNCYNSPGCHSFKVCNINLKTIKKIQKNKILSRLYPNNIGLFTHEWKKHGTCSGLTQFQYFKQALRYKNAIFPKLKNLFSFIKRHKNETVKTSDIRMKLPKNTSLWCKKYNGKNYLYEINFFITTKGSEFINTNTQIGDKCSQTLTLAWRNQN